MPKRNYHMSLSRIGPDDWWRCSECGEEGACDDLRKTDCAHEYPTCLYCGGCDESNECLPDCPGVLELLVGLGINPETAEKPN